MSDPNKNRAGYTETKAGWIPDEWGISTGAEVTTIISKGASPKWQGFSYGDSGMLFITSENVRDGFLDISEPKFLPLEFNDKLKRSQVKKGDILINLVGASIGRSCEVRDDVGTANVNQAVAVFRLKEPSRTRFTALYFQAPNTIRRILGMQVDAARPNISLTDLRDFPVPEPPLPEQQEIAAILFTCDEAIEKTGALIDAKKRQKKALMQQLLTGKKRLPGFEGDRGRTEYRFFDLPSDWACPHVREVAQERSERNGESDSHTVLACSKHLGFVESKSYFKKQVFSENTSNYKVVRRGWFGFPSNHVEEGSIGLLSTHDSGIVSPIYCVFETSSQIAPDYLYAVFKSETFRHIFSVTTNASVDRRGSLRWDAFGSIRIPCPALDEQIAIAAVNRAAADEIDTLQNKLSALTQQKKALMQKLLTGQIRVKL